jgi:hypothetical protein
MFDDVMLVGGAGSSSVICPSNVTKNEDECTSFVRKVLRLSL